MRIRKIEKVTAQNMFDDAARHMLTQRKKSMSQRGRSICAYRGANGLSCPIGARIPDDEYDAAFENKSVSYITTRPGCKSDLLARRLRAAARVPENLGGLARAIQLVHDADTVAEWPGALRELATRKGLKPACLDTETMKSKARLCKKAKP